MSEDSEARKDAENFRLKAAYEECRSAALVADMGAGIVDDVVRLMAERGYRFVAVKRLASWDFPALPVEVTFAGGKPEAKAGSEPCKGDFVGDATDWEDLKAVVVEVLNRSTPTQPAGATDRLKRLLQERGFEIRRDPMHLRPCPHCGGEGQFREKPTKQYYWRIECVSCHMKTDHFTRKAAAIEVWNRRPGAPR